MARTMPGSEHLEVVLIRHTMNGTTFIRKRFKSASWLCRHLSRVRIFHHHGADTLAHHDYRVCWHAHILAHSLTAPTAGSAIKSNGITDVSRYLTFILFLDCTRRHDVIWIRLFLFSLSLVLLYVPWNYSEDVFQLDNFLSWLSDTFW